MTRPFVTSSKRTISARIGKVGRRNAYLSIDGGKAFKSEHRRYHSGHPGERGTRSWCG